MTHVLVTGGAGFIGSHITDLLVDEGYDVTVIDNLTDQVHDGKPEYVNDEAEYVWENILDRSLMTDLLSKSDVLCHQASAVGVGQSMYEIEKYVESNTLATAGLLDIIVNEDVNLEKIVVASSMSLYGEGKYRCETCTEARYPSIRPGDRLSNGIWEHTCDVCRADLTPLPTPESKPVDARSIYAITKRDQEDLCLTIGRTYDIPTVALRYFNTYGSRQALENPYTGVCAIFSARIKNGNPPLVYEDGRQLRDFVHVKDVARANQAAIEHDEADGLPVNIGSGKARTIREIADALIEFYGKRDELDYELPNEFRHGDIRHCYADTARAEQTLGFECQVGFEEGMRELVSWADEQAAADNFEQAITELDEKDLV